MLALAMPRMVHSASSAQRPPALNVAFAPDEIALIVGSPGSHMCLVLGQVEAGEAPHPKQGLGAFPIHPHCPLVVLKAECTQLSP